MAFSLRRLTQDEMHQAAAIHRTAFDERLPWLAGLHTPEQDRAFFRNRVFETCEVWGAVGPTLVGFIAFRSGWVEQLYILPAHQNRGIGSMLLRRAKADASTLQLYAFQKNRPARMFYERHGFIAIKESDGRGNEEKEPDVLYRWDRPTVS